VVVSSRNGQRVEALGPPTPVFRAKSAEAIDSMRVDFFGSDKEYVRVCIKTLAQREGEKVRLPVELT